MSAMARHGGDQAHRGAQGLQTRYTPQLWLVRGQYGGNCKGLSGYRGKGWRCRCVSGGCVEGAKGR